MGLFSWLNFYTFRASPAGNIRYFGCNMNLPTVIAPFFDRHHRSASPASLGTLYTPCCFLIRWSFLSGRNINGSSFAEWCLCERRNVHYDHANLCHRRTIPDRFHKSQVNPRLDFSLPFFLLGGIVHSILFSPAECHCYL